MPSDGISTREILDTIDANPKVRICSVINVRVCMYLEGTEDTLRNEWLDRCPTSVPSRPTANSRPVPPALPPPRSAPPRLPCPALPHAAAPRNGRGAR